MNTFTKIIAIIILAFVVNITYTYAGGDKDKVSATPEVSKKEHKALKGVMVLDKMPVLDKDICGMDLNFDIIVDGNTVELFNKSVGSFSHVEVLFGDGTTANNFEDKHTYDKDGVKYIAVSIYDESTGCMDFVGANVFVGDKGVKTTDKVIINAKDLQAEKVANL